MNENPSYLSPHSWPPPPLLSLLWRWHYHVNCTHLFTSLETVRFTVAYASHRQGLCFVHSCAFSTSDTWLSSYFLYLNEYMNINTSKIISFCKNKVSFGIISKAPCYNNRKTVLQVNATYLKGGMRLKWTDRLSKNAQELTTSKTESEGRREWKLSSVLDLHYL